MVFSGILGPGHAIFCSAAASDACGPWQVASTSSKVGLYMHGNGPARDFHGLDRRIPLDERDHQNAKYVEEGMLRFGLLAHVGANGADQAVAQQNAEEGPTRAAATLCPMAS